MSNDISSFPFTVSLVGSPYEHAGSAVDIPGVASGAEVCISAVRSSIEAVLGDGWPIDLKATQLSSLLSGGVSAGGLVLDDQLLVWKSTSFTQADVTQLAAAACGAAPVASPIAASAIDISAPGAGSPAGSLDFFRGSPSDLSPGGDSIGSPKTSTSDGGPGSGGPGGGSSGGFSGPPPTSAVVVQLTSAGNGSVPVPEIDALSGIAALALLAAGTALVRERMRR